MLCKRETKTQKNKPQTTNDQRQKMTHEFDLNIIIFILGIFAVFFMFIVITFLIASLVWDFLKWILALSSL